MPGRGFQSRIGPIGCQNGSWLRSARSLAAPQNWLRSVTSDHRRAKNRWLRSVSVSSPGLASLGAKDLVDAPWLRSARQAQGRCRGNWLRLVESLASCRADRSRWLRLVNFRPSPAALGSLGQSAFRLIYADCWPGSLASFGQSAFERHDDSCHPSLHWVRLARSFKTFTCRRRGTRFRSDCQRAELIIEIPMDSVL